MPSKSLILVRHIYHEIKPGGGPHGYLYYLRESLAEYGQPEGVELDIKEIINPNKTDLMPRSFPRRVARRLKRELLSHWPERRSAVEPEIFEQSFRIAMQRYSQLYDWIGPREADELFSCDLLVVHMTMLAERLIQLRPAMASQKLALITHSPMFVSYQVASDIAPDANDADIYGLSVVKEYVKREIATMQSVRTVGWPCPEAQCGYPEWYDLYQEGKVRSTFVETCVPKPSPRADTATVRSQWGIDLHQKVALFMGRPHPHKGFDRFVDWADVVKGQGRSDWVFLQAGAKSVSGRDLSSISQVGYIDDNAASYLAADLVLIPNRHTYLDIGLLEALSLGAKIVISPTGGHGKIVRDFPVIPTILDASPEVTWTNLEQVAAQYAAGSDLQEQFKDMWLEHFSPAIFLRNHVNFAREIIDRGVA